MPKMQKISSCLWFDSQAETAAAFYVSVFPDSRIDRLMRSGVEWPGGEAGSVVLVDFTLAGQSFQALNGGPQEPFNDAISLSVNCEEQAEVDRYWAALTADGGAPVQCGWLRDKFGLSWQIVPEVLPRMLRDDDPDKARRVMEAMMRMVKIDIRGLQAAYDGP